MRIMIIGYSGSGKSTLARALAAKYAVPALHLDTVHHLPGWRERNRAEELEIVDRFLRKNEGWVIDGNYSKLCYEERLEAADRIVMMLFNRFACLWRAWQRYRRYRGRSRPDMTEGCPEKLDGEFIRWILRDGRRKTARARYNMVRAKYPDKVTVLKNQRQLNAFMRREGL